MVQKQKKHKQKEYVVQSSKRKEKKEAGDASATTLDVSPGSLSS